ncbi:hypothetical protein BC936DRAFT_148814 [Jimgerdemannia flammicorona]|uniref:GAF domain-containing protein n=1 Tax=Jimgerdemannia flammicorona TaxID=994334 RepID=A0A433D288_9FUNG|nr:hypothetical protein BC936DRAFT_148814 [Jimgerdemannia flammicorona]
MVNLVLRTRKPALTNNASKDPNYCRDPYVSRSQPKSIACLPIVQNEVLGVVDSIDHNVYGGVRPFSAAVSGKHHLNASLVVSLQEATIAKSEMLHREQVARAEAEAKEQKICCFKCNLIMLPQYRVLVDGMPNLVWTARPGL